MNGLEKDIPTTAKPTAARAVQKARAARASLWEDKASRAGDRN